MKSPAAFRATFSDMKLVKTRQVAQLIFEIPLSDFDAAYEVLGGLPDSSKERWFGIAAINLGKEEMPNPPVPQQLDAQPRPNLDKPSAGAKRDWEEIQPSQQAGIHSHDPRFAIFLEEEFPEEWNEFQDAAECIRSICCVKSRAELGTDQRKRILWHQLDSRFDAWLLKERVGA